MMNEIKFAVCSMRNKVETIVGANQPKQYVNHNAAFIALHILETIDYKNTWDILLGCICSNLLNTYVKQKDRRINYDFKQLINKITNYLCENNDTNIHFSVECDRGMTLLIIEIQGVQQFSFHCIDTNNKLIQKSIEQKEKYGEIIWNGIRNQFAAVSIFDCKSQIVRKCSNPNIVLKAEKYISGINENRKCNRA